MERIKSFLCLMTDFMAVGSGKLELCYKREQRSPLSSWISMITANEILWNCVTVWYR